MADPKHLNFNDRLVLGLTNALKYFGLPILFSILAAIVFIMEVACYDCYPALQIHFFQVIIGAWVGLALSTAASIWSRQSNASRLLAFGAYAAAAGLAGAYTLYCWVTEATEFGLLTVYVLLASHLLISISVSRTTDQKFWVFNWTLLLGFLRSGVLAIILFLGVALAIGSFSLLFGIDHNSKIYLYAWILTALVFHPFNFYANLLTQFNKVQAFDYPKYLRNLIQYVLLPLVILYVAILYLFSFKILFIEETKGYTAWLVLILSVVGILALLLAYPMRQDVNEGWVRRWDRLYFWLMIPLIALLVYSLSLRVNQYGYTENRIVIIYLIVWLAILTVYMLTKRRFGIAFIPISLLGLTMVSMMGPLSPTSLANRFQTGVVLQLIDQYQLKLNPATEANVPKEDQAKFQSALTYLVWRKAIDDLPPNFQQVLNKDIIDGMPNHNPPTKLMTLLGIKALVNDKSESNININLCFDLDSGYVPLRPINRIFSSIGGCANDSNQEYTDYTVTYELDQKAVVIYHQGKSYPLIMQSAFRQLDMATKNGKDPMLRYALPKPFPAGEVLITKFYFYGNDTITDQNQLSVAIEYLVGIYQDEAK